MKVSFTRGALKDLDGLSRIMSADEHASLVRRIMDLNTGVGGRDLKKLGGRGRVTYRVRIGKYRVFFEWRGSECVVLEVVDRKDAY